MSMSVRVGALALLVFLMSSICEAQPSDRACVEQVFEGARFTVCAFDADKDGLQLVARDRTGKPFRRLPVLAAALGEDARRVRFAMNAGMFDLRGAPIGLYIEQGRLLKPLNRRDGVGNFHLKPNGVFWVGADGGVHVSTTDDYAAWGGQPTWATQSGPMLVIDGKVHPAFSEDGASRHIRNGVGVMGERRAAFVISEEKVSFGKFARFFRDVLKADNALYLDGAVSSLWAPSLNRMDAARDLGPLIVVTSP